MRNGADPWDSSALLEQRQIDRAAHRLIPRIVWMQVIAAVILRQELRGLLRIPGRGVEIDHAVERLARPDPGIDGGTLGLAGRREVASALERSQRRANHLEPARVRALDDLLLGG